MSSEVRLTIDQKRLACPTQKGKALRRLVSASGAKGGDEGQAVF